ncbi:MAG: zinc-ribbon domain-containing protein [Alphaproteobacteria bacterium]|nr:zinc-ribbon domain-containing protein [Alphaproteobacteria bacterium]
MILTCPQCGSRFSLKAELLAPNGRKVRCASCKHTWHQLPDPAELGETLPADTDEDIEADFAKLEEQAIQQKEDFIGEDIPKALRPDSRSAAGADDDSGKRSYARRRMIVGGVLGVVAILLPAAIVLILAQNTLVRVWPASYALYDALGVANPVDGEGLVFEKTSASLKKADDGTILLVVEGQIINLKSEDRRVPMIEASLRDGAGESISRWMIAPPEDIVPAEGAMPFTAETEFEHDKAVSVNLRFMAGSAVSKTVLEDGGNSPVPHADDTAHPTGHEEASESPAHGDAPLHQESQPAHTPNSDHHSDHH